jgi:glycosyltransferase involved in cell wall biosynthesis
MTAAGDETHSPSASSRGLVLYVNTDRVSAVAEPGGDLGIGGMQTHSHYSARGMRARGWTVEELKPERPYGSWLPPTVPNMPRTLAFVDSMAWPWLTPRLRSSWPAMPIVVCSGGSDAHIAIGQAREQLAGDEFARWVEEISASVDLLITCSRYSVRRLELSYLWRIPAVAVIGGADAPVQASRQGRSEPPAVVVVGRLVESKGVDDCIDAVAIAQRSRELELTVVGDGPRRQKLEQLARERLRPGTWRFTGALRHEACLAEIGGAAVLLSMSRPVYEGSGRRLYLAHNESMGRAICEALVSGVPVVAAAVGGVPEVVTPGAGTLVPKRDVNAAAEAILSHVSGGRLDAAEISAQRARLGWDAVLDAYERLLDELLAERTEPTKRMSVAAGSAARTA